MSRFNWISLDDILCCHKRVVDQFGGKSEIRDSSLFELSVSRVETFASYSMNSDVGAHTLSALYADSIVNGRPFLGGNKATGLLVSALFLEINGYEFHATDRQTIDAVDKLADGHSDYVEFSKFLKENSTKR